MSDSAKEILKEGTVAFNPKPGRAVWLDLLVYTLRSLGIGCLMYLLIAFAIVSISSSPSFQTTPSQNFMIAVILLFLGSALGPFSGAVAKTGYVYWQYFLLPVLLILLIVAGYKYRKAWWGKALGVFGVCSWLLVGSGLL